MNNTTWLVIDGYEDEPAAFGVPPYVGFHIRYVCGVLEEHDLDYSYMTIDQIRIERRRGTLEKCFKNIEGVIILAGAIVPGKYVRGTPISRKEVDALIGEIKTDTKILCGGWAIRGWRQQGWTPLRPSLFLAHHDLDATLDLFLRDGSFKHARRTAEQWHRWALAGASSKAITTHPDLPDPLTVEIELYQGCVRFQRGCRFCIEPKKGAPVNRPIRSIIDEVTIALDAGAQHVRLGGATCIYTWHAEGVGELEHPRPNPEPIAELLHTLREDERLDILHVDNANPSIIAEHLEESEIITRLLVDTLSDGAVLSFGLESADSQVHDANWLNCTTEQFRTAVRHINEFGSERGPRGLPQLLPGVNLIAGLHGERESTWNQNHALLASILKEGLMLRRVNLRQVEGAGFPEIDKERFQAEKRRIRETVDSPMLERIAPLRNILRKVRWEAHGGRIRTLSDVEQEKHRDLEIHGQGGITFGRQVGAYPLLIGVPYLIPLETVSDVVVTDHGQRSVTAIEIGLDPISVTEQQLRSIPGIGEKTAWSVVADRAQRRLEGYDSIKPIVDLTTKEAHPWLTTIFEGVS